MIESSWLLAWLGYEGWGFDDEVGGREAWSGALRVCVSWDGCFRFVGWFGGSEVRTRVKCRERGLGRGEMELCGGQ